MKSAPSKLFDLQNFAKKTKMPNFGAKNPYLVFFIKNALFENFIAKIFSKIIVIFQISTLKFVKLQTFMKKQNCLNFRPKMSYSVFMKQNFEKLLLYLRSTPSNLSNCKVLQKSKNPSIQEKNALFFQARTLKRYCHV